MNIASHFLSAIGAVAFGVYILLPSSLTTPPVKIEDIQITTNPVVQGGILGVVITTTDVGTACDGTIFATVLHGERPSRLITFEPQYQPGINRHEYEPIVREYAMPAGAAVGVARFRAQLQLSCEWPYNSKLYTVGPFEVSFYITELEDNNDL